MSILFFKTDKSALERQVEGEKTSSRKEKRKSHGEKHDVEHEASADEAFVAPFEIEVEPGDDRENERRHLGKEADHEKNAACELDECRKADEEAANAEKGIEKIVPALAFFPNLQITEIDENKPGNDADDEWGEEAVIEE